LEPATVYALTFIFFFFFFLTSCMHWSWSRLQISASVKLDGEGWWSHVFIDVFEQFFLEHRSLLFLSHICFFVSSSLTQALLVDVHACMFHQLPTQFYMAMVGTHRCIFLLLCTTSLCTLFLALTNWIGVYVVVRLWGIMILFTPPLFLRFWFAVVHNHNSCAGQSNYILWSCHVAIPRCSIQTTRGCISWGQLQCFQQRLDVDRNLSHFRSVQWETWEWISISETLWRWWL
jgi:hypothetical protein